MSIKNIIIAAITVAAICSCNKESNNTIGRAVNASSSKWISKIVDYRPAPGQFINEGIGSQTGAQSIVGKRGMVSLGGFGGYIIFTFDHTVLNSNGADFMIHGNAFDGSSEAGAVEVSFDANSNGIADDTWYALQAPSDASATRVTITYTRPTQTTQSSDVNWTISNGTTGRLESAPIKAFHTQCHYPLFLVDNPSELILSGLLLPQKAVLDPLTGFWNLPTISGNGYVDNFSDDYMQIIGSDKDTERSNKFDISTAINSQGVRVELAGVDFIKVYTCINDQAGSIGECSTEVCGAISLSVKSK